MPEPTPIAKFRKQLEVSQAEFAAGIGVSRSVIANTEAGRTPLSAELISKVSDVFGLDPGQFVRGKWAKSLDRKAFDEASANPIPKDELQSEIEGLALLFESSKRLIQEASSPGTQRERLASLISGFRVAARGIGRSTLNEELAQKHERSARLKCSRKALQSMFPNENFEEISKSVEAILSYTYRLPERSLQLKRVFQLALWESSRSVESRSISEPPPETFKKFFQDRAI